MIPAFGMPALLRASRAEIRVPASSSAGTDPRPGLVEVEGDQHPGRVPGTEPAGGKALDRLHHSAIRSRSDQAPGADQGRISHEPTPAPSAPGWWCWRGAVSRSRSVFSRSAVARESRPARQGCRRRRPGGRTRFLPRPGSASRNPLARRAPGSTESLNRHLVEHPPRHLAELFRVQRPTRPGPDPGGLAHQRRPPQRPAARGPSWRCPLGRLHYHPDLLDPQPTRRERLPGRGTVRRLQLAARAITRPRRPPGGSAVNRINHAAASVSAVSSATVGHRPRPPTPAATPRPGTPTRTAPRSPPHPRPPTAHQPELTTPHSTARLSLLPDARNGASGVRSWLIVTYRSRTGIRRQTKTSSCGQAIAEIRTPRVARTMWTPRTAAMLAPATTGR